MNNEEVYVVGMMRSPIASVRRGKAGQANTSCISSLTPNNLAAQVLRALFQQSQIYPDQINTFVMGSVISQKVELDMFHAPAKNIIRISNAPNKNVRLNAHTIEGACASGLLAIEDAAEEILLEKAEIAVAGGVDMMSRQPNAVILETLTDPEENKLMAILADRKARMLGLSREDHDQYSFESYELAKNHRQDYGDNVVPIVLRDGEPPVLVNDEWIDRALTFDFIQKLSVLPECKIMTLAHSSKYGDAAGFVILASAEAVRKNNLRPLARILSFGSSSKKKPEDFITAPFSAIEQAIYRAGLILESIDYFEINEAFASSPLSFMYFNVPREKINPWGGAIAHGHPIGATGAILMIKLINILRKEQKKYGVVALCSAIGEAIAAVIEVTKPS